MTLIKTFCFCCTMIVPFIITAQSDEVDSLKKILVGQRDDTNKVKTLNKLSESVTDLKLQMQYGEMAKNLSENLNYSKGVARALINLGDAQLRMSNYFEAYNYFDSSIQVYKLINDKKGEASALWSFAAVLIRDREKALDYGLEALKISEEIRDTGSIISNLQLVGYLKANSGIPELKKMLYLSSIFRKDEIQTLQTYVMIGRSYSDLGAFDSALYYYREAQNACRDASDTLYTLRELSETYAKMKNYDLAIKYYTQLYEQAKLFVSGSAYLASATLGLGKIYLEKEDYQTALKYYRWAEKFIPDFGYNKDEVYKGLITINEKKGDFKETYTYQKKLQAYLDTSHSRQLKENLIPVQLNFNIRKKQDSALLIKNKLLSELQISKVEYRNQVRVYFFLGGIVVFLLLIGVLYRGNRNKQKANILLNQQKEELSQALHELKSTQNQLIQSEKMASLGELTAGIAHEIQNPLNFVNNFSELSNELIDEMHGEIDRGNTIEAKQIASDIKQNLEKINHHGKRADSIVKGMLQHSKASTGKKELIDVNSLTSEYLNLAYHGMRAKDKLFNVNMKTEFDEKIKKINIVPQDIGRAILNLINNAFYAVNEKKKLKGEGYDPFVIVSTRQNKNSIEIKVSDNGNGIPQNILNKIFQPFFTTKPTGQGTGLGLSLSYDIITKEHAGELKVESKEEMGSEFTISLPA